MRQRSRSVLLLAAGQLFSSQCSPMLSVAAAPIRVIMSRRLTSDENSDSDMPYYDNMRSAVERPLK
eukprot:scaffold459_cov117-Isochrysis_galbana.AAC.5